MSHRPTLISKSNSMMSVCNCGGAFLLGGRVRVVIKEQIGGHAAWCRLAPSQTTVTCLYSD